MKETISHKNWRPVQVPISGVWSRNPWNGSRRIGTQLGQKIDISTQVRNRKDTKQQGAALNAWEDEGGTTATTAPTKSVV